MDNNSPLVSCIMPTANRDSFVPMAILYFLKQDYLKKELIIIDDGIKPINHLIPTDPLIRYFRVKDGPHLIGAKRNMACKEAGGDIIIHWDDDDWYAPDWITRQVAALNTPNANISGLKQLYFFDPVNALSWRYEYPAIKRPWVAGATMAYRKSFWQQEPFKNIQIGEDNNFVWRPGARIATNEYCDGFVSILHPGNTSPKHTTSSYWKQCDVRVVEKILANDIANYKA